LFNLFKRIEVMFIYSLLEQFEIIPIYPLLFGFFDVSITNSVFILGLIFLLLFFILQTINSSKDFSLVLIPTVYQFIVEQIYLMISGLISDNLGAKKGSQFFPLVFSVFLFILCLNVIGLIPYSFTLTSHLILTFSFSFFLFLGINIIAVLLHKMQIFSLFLPKGTVIFLAFLLVPIELISYISKPISLSIRLFANMMAGHALLKVIAGFAITLMGCQGVYFILHYFVIGLLFPLFLLEFGVALIQSFVFSLLICIYLNDAINLH
jgi:ATP synthase subunit 6